MAEALEAAQEVAAYEPEEDETVTSGVIKKALKELIDDLKGSSGKSAQKELHALQTQQNALTAIETRILPAKDLPLAVKLIGQALQKEHAEDKFLEFGRIHLAAKDVRGLEEKAFQL